MINYFQRRWWHDVTKITGTVLAWWPHLHCQRWWNNTVRGTTMMFLIGVMFENWEAYSFGCGLSDTLTLDVGYSIIVNSNCDRDRKREWVNIRRVWRYGRVRVCSNNRTDTLALTRSGAVCNTYSTMRCGTVLQSPADMYMYLFCKMPGCFIGSEICVLVGQFIPGNYILVYVYYFKVNSYFVMCFSDFALLSHPICVPTNE